MKPVHAGVEKTIYHTMEVEILSRKMIKPSIPTSNHLQNMKLSFIDQLSPPMYVPLVFCYPNGDTHDTAKEIRRKCDLLEISLSEILVKYYPFAGRLNNDGVNVDCNDQGVEYCETKVSGRLGELIQNGREKMELLDRLAPHIGAMDFQETPLVAIQVNIFDCGGIAIAVSVSHRIADAITGIRFINQWATTSRDGVSQVDQPNFDLASYIPSRSLPDGAAGPTVTWTDHSPIKFVTKRFLFDKTALAILKEKSMPASRAMLVSAVIWKALIGVKQGGMKTSLLVHSVNLRAKTVPPVPVNACGNFYMSVTTRLELDTGRIEFHPLVELISDSIRKTIDNIPKEVGSQEFFEAVYNSFKEFREEMRKEDVSLYFIVSWCRMPLYDADFGWGKPSWVGRVQTSWELITLKDTVECGDGIEAWITLTEGDMLRFQQDHDILTFTS